MVQKTNCLTEIWIDSALSQADFLDTHLRTTRVPFGPLHGLPISVADRFHVNGKESACGFVSWLGDIKTEADEGVLLKRLRSLGAVVFCKTAMPMTMMVSLGVVYVRTILRVDGSAVSRSSGNTMLTK